MKKLLAALLLAVFLFSAALYVYAEDESTASFTAETPVITLAPSGITADVGAYFWLAANGSVGDGGTLSYQWYISDTGDTADIKPIYSLQYPFYGRQNTFTPDQFEGTKYYCVEITNTLEKDGETATASVFSELTAVTFNAVAESSAEAETSSSDTSEVNPERQETSAVTAVETTEAASVSESETETLPPQSTEQPPASETVKADVTEKAEDNEKTAASGKFNLSFVIIVTLSVLLVIAIFVIVVLLMRLRSYR